MSRRPILHLASLLIPALLLGACTDSPAAPDGRSVPSADLVEGVQADALPATGATAQVSRVAVCLPRGPETASKTIGPKGGILRVGDSFLFVPPGALAASTVISGTAATDGSAAVHFQPSGLVFAKPARLFIDADGCSLPGGAAPSVLYIGDDGTVSERIQATFYEAWGWVAAPISHFSQYAIGV